MARKGARARARARSKQNLAAKQNLEAKEKAKPKHIPSDLRDLIFSLLPLKSLLRFKSVCKNWSSIISGLPNHRSWRCAVAGNALYSFPVDGSHRISDHHHDLAKRNDLYRRSYNSEILGSCNGVLLLHLSSGRYTDGGDDFLLLNPTTGRSRAFKGRRYSDCSSSSSISGLAYDSRNHDFKVFIANQNFSPPSSPGYRFGYQYYSYELFSTRSGFWTDLHIFFPYISYSDRLGISLNGAPHWVLHRHFRDYESFRPELPDSSVIVWFDPTDDEFEEILLPDWLADHEGRIELGILRERLCVVASDGLNNEFETWLMMEHGVEESWTKLFVFNSHSFPIMSLTVLRPLCCNGNGELILMVADRNKLVVYDVRDEIWRIVGTVSNQLRFSVAAYVESSLDPNRKNGTMRGWDEEDEYDYVLKY